MTNNYVSVLIPVLRPVEREHSATIKDKPVAYEESSSQKAKNIIEMDCRGLEFVEFKADVSAVLCKWGRLVLMVCRVNGKLRVLSRGPNLRAWILVRESGLTMMRRLEKKLAYGTSSG